MSVILLGLGYLVLAATGAACWGLALARPSGPDRDLSLSASRTASLAVAGALAALAIRWLVTIVLVARDWGFAQEKVVAGLPISTAASILAVSMWRMPRRRVSASRDGITAGAIAAATASCVAEILLTIGIGAPVGPFALAAVLGGVVGAGVVTALLRTRRSGGSRRPVLAAAAAAGSVIAGTIVVGVITMSGAEALHAAGFGPVASHGHDPGVPAGEHSTLVPYVTAAPHELDVSGASIPVLLRARQQEIALPSGRTANAWTFGEIAGPAIVARVGDTLDVSLTNVDVESGATVHWHGYPVANAFDGVAGVTQNAVEPGGEFRAHVPLTRPGTFWYHTHQRGSVGVLRGLYGTLVVHPASGPTEDVDLTLPVHTFSGSVVIGASDVVEERVVDPGASVRLRLINTDQTPHTYVVQGVPFHVAAIDGTEVSSMALEDRSVVVPAGSRIDVVVEMPAASVRVGVAGASKAGVGLVPRAGDDIPALIVPSKAFDPLADLIGVGATAYPEAATAIDAALGGAGFDVERAFVLDRLPRIVQGTPNYGYTVDGRVYPFIEPTIVDPGDTVRLRFANRSFETHPMHPHGHSVRVLSMDGRVPDQPLWLDTFDVGPGEVWEVALYADNPGIWMDHCHNLEHAALGMVTHLAYRGITTPFEHGGPAGNAPE